MTASNALREDAKLAALEQRVYGLERGVQDLNQQFTGRIAEVSAQLVSLTTKLDDRSRTPWATIVSAMGVVLAIVIAGGQLAKAPVDEAIARLERDVASSTPVTAFADFKATYENNRLVARQDNDARFARVDGALEAMRQELARAPSRAELDARGRLEEQGLQAVAREMEALRRAIDAPVGQAGQR